MNGSSLVVAAGAHDALSAKIVEGARFDVVWASSFGISLASQCVPDTDLITMSETVDTVRHMVAATDLPVLVDCNSSFGNAVNTIRLVRDCEAAGAAGVCIEDNPFPKRSSLYTDWDRHLIPIPEMVAKVRAATSTRLDADFLVVARVESLIANEDLDLALCRASAYADAGADAILIHGREYGPILEFVRQWDDRRPLVVVPTLFPHVSFAQLDAAGFRLAIFPNQAIRAAIRAMSDVLASMRVTGGAATVESRIAPLGEVYELVDLDGLRAAEERYCRSEAATSP
jgi:phosphoenolpyruvate phosphomutase